MIFSESSSKRIKGGKSIVLLLLLCTFLLAQQSFFKLDYFLEPSTRTTTSTSTNSGNRNRTGTLTSSPSPSPSTPSPSPSSSLLPTDEDKSPPVDRRSPANESIVDRPTNTTNAPPGPGGFSQKGSWSGNTWNPPLGWRHYEPWQLSAMYNTSSVLWVGDSTVRRASLTWHELLSSSSLDDPADWGSSRMDQRKILDVSKLDDRVECRRFAEGAHVHRPRICRPIISNSNTTIATAQNGKEYWYIRQNCLADLQFFFLNEVEGKSNFTASMDLIVIGMSGVWDFNIPGFCVSQSKNRDLLTIASDLRKILAEFQR